jgi:soluble lytic murein transglycosylase-like protein
LRMLDLPVLGGFPALAEAWLREVALLAWAYGDREAAGAIFMEYLAIASTADLSEVETAILDHLVSDGIRSESELALLRGKRLYDLRRYEPARRLLSEALVADKADTRAEAGYYLARTRSMQGAPTSEVISLVTAAIKEAADPDLIQKGLSYRASIYKRQGGEADIERFTRDLSDIVERFPSGRTADDALYELAVYNERQGNTDEALRTFARLRDHSGPNDWLASSYFRPALLLYSRHGEGDIAAATRLLQNLLAVDQMGQLGLAARFWLGRIAEEEGDTTSARRCFRKVIATCPYDYYAIRARMHCNMGPEADREIWADPETRTDLLASYASAPTEAAACDTPAAGVSGAISALGALHRAALEADRRLRDALPAKEQSELTVEDLDLAGAVGPMTLLLAFRQDATEDPARTSTPADRLRAASSLGLASGDWPLAMLIVFGLDRSVATQSGIQRDPHYLTIAYPPVYAELLAAAARANGVPPELLYAVIRRESLFYPAAVSGRGAMGLFQFIPSTFATLDARWDVLDRSGMPSMEAFLRDPGLTIALGARWFREELLDGNDGNILLAVMEHNAGYPAVKTWCEAWNRSGHMGDVEYMIETAYFVETRIFARSVLTDMVIAEAAGTVRPDPAGRDR